MSRLSSPITAMQDRYDAIVIGSGYGGGIAASRLARAGRRVCLLERGREIRPGEYPNTLLQATGELQMNTPDGHVGDRLGMFEIHVNHDMNALVGCGLGGTSLINANVALRTDVRVFDDPRWPQEIRDDLETRIEEGFRRAEEMLKPNPYPDSREELPKTRAHRLSAEGMGKGSNWYRTPINVTFEDGVNHVGVEQKACNDCGDCVSGCNNHAKNTTLMNYLPDAWNHGAELYTCCSVRHIEKTDGGWVVHFELLGQDREKFDAPELMVAADIVVVAAGALGSSEIMLRSKENGLSMSSRLGQSYSGNGDVLGFGFNADETVNGVGFGDKNPDKMEPVGPCITSIIDLRDSEDVWDGFVIEEGSVPGAMASMQFPALELGATTVGDAPEQGIGETVESLGREAASLLFGARHGAVHNSQTYLIMSHDGADGELRLEQDRLRTVWPGVGTKPIFETANNALRDASHAIGATYIENPIWMKAFHNSLVSVHNLGGCAMGDAAESGVVNHKCQVFSGESGDEVHEGLYVADGAVLPTSVGVNPLFTISAIAERAMAMLCEDHGWDLSYALPSAPPADRAEAASAGPHMGIKFTETMKGNFTTEVTNDFTLADERGASDGSAMEFTLTIMSDDLETMLEDPDHEAKMVGTVIAAGLSAEPMTVSDSQFRLFVSDPDHVDTRLMVYRMKLSTVEGRTLYFHGYKHVDDASVIQSWPETSTLYTAVHDGEDDSAPVLGMGILHIRPSDFAVQMTTMEVTDAPSITARLEGLAKFGKAFAGTLYEQYGGVFVGPSHFDPDAPPRERRALQAPTPVVHDFQTSDGVMLRLTRYEGGEKGPILLVHGGGYSSHVFSTDLPETNLVEFLVAAGYDTWLLDYRASTALPSAADDCDCDQIATIDWPEAVAQVREMTGTDDILVFSHCVGAQTFLMAMLAGMRGVRSAICSQVGLHPVVPTEGKIAAALHLPTLLDLMGVDSVDAYTDDDTSWAGKLIDSALNLGIRIDDSACKSAVCHRMQALYGMPYEHENLSQLIHDNVHELFGVSNIELMKHIALMIREGHAVSADGEDTYMPHLDRLAIPIKFLFGSENKVYVPISTERTYDLLRESNDPALYEREGISSYGHLDLIFGARAAEEVFSHVIEFFEKRQAAAGA